MRQGTRDNGWIFGVCAGLADRFNLQVGVVRTLAVISLLIFFWLTAAIYIAATLLIREKPLVYSGSRSEYEFWRRERRQQWREQ
jgi:phage shock protein C